ncbi:glycosyltransferase family 2 protein [Chitinophaga sp. 30R24]|uniref:glycosyltransferase family 2 protein n=1 Tax=Chitinophaga sp. 30R24 TaxID=3248838 RepID=UPI003B9086C6
MYLSIIIPFYKGEAFIQPIVSSIVESARINSLSYKIQIIVVIDSMESQLELIKNGLSSFVYPGIKILVVKNAKNLGVAKTRNVGISLAQGDWLLFIDQDDMVTTDFFRVIHPKALEKSDFVLCNGVIAFEDKIRYRIYYIKPYLSYRHILLDDFIRSPGQVLVRKCILDKLGFPAPSKFHGADDKFCWVQLFYTNPKLRTLFIKECLYVANIHERNFSHDQRNLRLSALDLWEVTLKRFPALREDKYVKRNIRLLKYQLNENVGVERVLGFLENLQYKFRLNKVFRIIVKRWLLMLYR